MAMTNMDKLCSGCRLYEQYIGNPKHYRECKGYKENHVKCPCIDCLIKVMCGIVCKEYMHRWENKDV